MRICCIENKNCRTTCNNKEECSSYKRFSFNPGFVWISDFEVRLTCALGVDRGSVLAPWTHWLPSSVTCLPLHPSAPAFWPPSNIHLHQNLLLFPVSLQWRLAVWLIGVEYQLCSGWAAPSCISSTAANDPEIPALCLASWSPCPLLTECS